ncbi:HSF-type DNA-binding-domain-containing protein [Paraphysoderma sedebokerense]|nr:HSF-type DNA-binding-domain-containing protein [Paraphysoderma sedebokerense]
MDGDMHRECRVFWNTSGHVCRHPGVCLTNDCHIPRAQIFHSHENRLPSLLIAISVVLGHPDTCLFLPSSSPPSAAGVRMANNASFIQKLYTMVQDESVQHLICWSESGDVFRVISPSEFSKEILPNYFKHSNLSSFIRQLNMYGFHKVSDNFTACNSSDKEQVWEFKHPHFKRGQVESLSLIKRKTPKSSASLKYETVTAEPSTAGNASDQRYDDLKRRMEQLEGRMAENYDLVSMLNAEIIACRGFRNDICQVMVRTLDYLSSVIREDDSAQSRRRQVQLDMIHSDLLKLYHESSRSKFPVDIPSTQSSVFPPSFASSQSSSHSGAFPAPTKPSYKIGNYPSNATLPPFPESFPQLNSSAPRTSQHDGYKTNPLNIPHQYPYHAPPTAAGPPMPIADRVHTNGAYHTQRLESHRPGPMLDRSSSVNTSREPSQISSHTFPFVDPPSESNRHNDFPSPSETTDIELESRRRRSSEPYPGAVLEDTDLREERSKKRRLAIN